MGASPGLPVHFWTAPIFKQIGDAMGKYLTYDDSFISSGRMAYARILVYLDLTDGLLEFINIQWRAFARRQPLDYKGVPFRCRRCHKVGHLFKDCPLNKWNSRHFMHHFPQSTREQEEQEQDDCVGEDLPQASVDFQRLASPRSGGTNSLSGSGQRSLAPALSAPRKRGRPPHRPSHSVPGLAAAASGDSYTSGSATQRLTIFPKKAQSGSKATG